MELSDTNKLHVLHVIGKVNDFGGTPAKLFYQMTAPSSRVRYTLCCLEQAGSMIDTFRSAGLDVIVLNYASNSDVGQLFALKKLLKKLSVDIVHTHFPRANTYGRLAALLSGIPTMISEHGVPRNTSLPVNFFDNVLNVFTKANISNSEATLKSVQRTVYLNRGNMQVIHNGVPDLFEGPPWADNKDVRDEFGMRHDDFILLNVGGHVEFRNIETLIRAMPLVRERIPKVQCVLIGDGPLAESLEAEAHRLNVADCVQFWKYRSREDIYRLLPAVDAFINPAIGEGFGIATVEAMLAERPVVCAASHSLLELIRDGEHGLFFPPGNEAKLADRIFQIYQDESLSVRLGKAARARARTAFSVERFIRDFEAVYESIAARGVGGAS